MTTSEVSHNPERTCASRDHLHPTADLLDYLREYVREKPEMAALWCFSIGFVLGWKLKPW